MDTKKSIHRWKEEKWGQGWEVCEIKCRACETKFIPLARAGTGGGGRALGKVSGGRFGTRSGGYASERWQKRHKSDGHPKVPRNTKQKKDRARAGVATLERGSQSGRLFSNNLPRRRGWRAAEGCVGWRFSGSGVGGGGGGVGGGEGGQRRLGAYRC